MAEKATQDGRTTLKEIFGVFRDNALESNEKVLWGLYRSYDSGDGAHPGDAVLAEHMGKSVRSVQVYRTRLIDLGFLTKEFRGSKPSLFRTTIPTQAPQLTAVQTSPSTAAHCGTKPVVPQVVPQPTAPPPHTPPYRKSTGSTGTTSVSKETGDGVSVDEETKREGDPLRGEFCQLIRKHLWQSKDPPSQAWTMDRELSIRKHLLRQGEAPEVINGVISLYRGEPTTLRIYWVKGARQRWQVDRAKYLTIESRKPLPATSTQVLGDVLRDVVSA